MMRRITLREKDLNARGNGHQITRRVLLPSGESGWATDYAENIEGSWSAGTFRASERHCSQSGQVPVGTLVLEYNSPFRGGAKTGQATMRGGIVVTEAEGRAVRAERLGADDGKSDCIRWGLATRRRGAVVEIQTPAGDWMAI